MEVAPPELCPPADGCLVQIAESASLNFSPSHSAVGVPQPHGIATTSGSCRIQKSCTPLSSQGRLCLEGSLVPWQGASCTACQNSTLLAAGSIFHLERPCGLCPCGSGCWGAAGGLAGPRWSARTFPAMGQYHGAFTGSCRNLCAGSAKGKKSFTDCMRISEFIH